MSYQSEIREENEVGDDLYNAPTGGVGSAGSGLTRETPKGKRRIGVQIVMADPRLVGYDRVGARSVRPISWEVSKNDRMSPMQAGSEMRKLYALYGIVGETPAVMEAFHDAIYFAHTLNGASVLQPGRATFSLDGNTMDFAKAVEYLGENQRRFFRAYADEVKDCNLRILAAAYDSSDRVAVEKAALLRQVAAAKGLSRHPELAHDTADACLHLPDGQVAALVSSKAAVFGSTPNMADRNRQRPGQSADTSVGNMFVNPTAQGNALAGI